MNTITTSTPHAMSPEALTVAIRHEHEAASTAARSALEHALEAGRLLAEAKATIPHGSWEAYVKDVCGIAPRTARLYQRLHRHRDRIPNRQHVADLSVRQAARLLEQPKAKAETGCDDSTKAEYWAARINAAWAAATDGIEADVGRIAESLRHDSIPPQERRKRERLLRERAGELAEMRTGCSPKSPEAAEQRSPIQAKFLAVCAEADYLHSCLRAIAAELPKDRRRSVAAFVDEQAERLSDLRQQLGQQQGATA